MIVKTGSFFAPHSFATLLLLGILLSYSPRALADSKQLAELLVSLSNARGDAVGRANRVQSCPSLMRQKLVADLILKYDDARTAHNSVIAGWTRVLAAGQFSPTDVATEDRQLSLAQSRVREFADASRAAILRSGCLTTKANWLGGIAVAILPVAVDKLWDYFKARGRDDESRRNLIRDLEGYLLPAWNSVGPVAVFDWTKDAFLAAGVVSYQDLQGGGVSIYVNKYALIKEPNKYFTAFKEPPPALKGAYYLYSGPLEELSEYAVIKGPGISPDKWPLK